MDQVMNDPGMISVLFPELFQDGGRLKLFRQARVVRRGVTNSQHRERVESLHFEIVRILVAQLTALLFRKRPHDRAVRLVHDTIVQPELRSNCPAYCNKRSVR